MLPNNNDTLFIGIVKVLPVKEFSESNSILLSSPHWLKQFFLNSFPNLVCEVYVFMWTHAKALRFFADNQEQAEWKPALPGSFMALLEWSAPGLKYPSLRKTLPGDDTLGC